MIRVLALTSTLLAASLAHADDPPVQIIVAAVDIPAGTIVTIDMLSQRGMPKQFVTSSIVKPDSAQYLLKQPTKRAMLQGDLMLWSSFDADVRIVEACEKKLSADADAVQQVRRARAAVRKK